ncbi:hypothetical protein BKA65DRAFT_545936 [Rhexocercosporidium sp. MPI-PUGE-AT-0058]|nr:hypothetical protein BKA65DRAFT_545936 [Rhexocercosporidium sp. MPI-PUGE-AT-0058]
MSSKTGTCPTTGTCPKAGNCLQTGTQDCQPVESQSSHELLLRYRVRLARLTGDQPSHSKELPSSQEWQEDMVAVRGKSRELARALCGSVEALIGRAKGVAVMHIHIEAQKNDPQKFVKAIIADANTTTRQTELQEQVPNERKSPKRVHLGNGLDNMQDENEDAIMVEDSQRPRRLHVPSRRALESITTNSLLSSQWSTDEP